jgi:RimJ/RimL family protein N-acetyltransferase
MPHIERLSVAAAERILRRAANETGGASLRQGNRHDSLRVGSRAFELGVLRCRSVRFGSDGNGDVHAQSVWGQRLLFLREDRIGYDDRGVRLAALVHRHAHAADYLAVVGSTLRRRPVINQLPLAIAETCARDPARYGPEAVFYSVELGGAISGAAVQTPPWPVQLSDVTPEAAWELAQAFAANHSPIPGVAGPNDAPAQFAEAYVAARGGSYALESSLGVFELTSVNELHETDGRWIVATPEHAALLQSWLEAFHDEATPQDPPPKPDSGASTAASSRAYLWLDNDDQPVSFLFNSREVEGWASIGPVYTPPALRGRGYATALVAAVSRHFLAQGRPGCTLFTDLENPTSNAIYERIGYRRIGSAFRYALPTSR